MNRKPFCDVQSTVLDGIHRFTLFIGDIIVTHGNGSMVGDKMALMDLARKINDVHEARLIEALRLDREKNNLA